MDGYAVTLTDALGEQWALTDGASGRSGVWLMGPPDLQSKVVLGVRSTTRQIGGEVTGWAIDPMVGTLKLGMCDESGRGLGDRYQQLMPGLSLMEESILTVVTPGHGEAEAFMRVDGALPMPSVSPRSQGLRVVELDVPVVAPDGCWLGDLLVSKASSTVWRNRGDLPARVLVRWSGAGASMRVRAPGGFDTGSVSLPSPPVGKQAELDLDPAVASRVTVDGQPHPDLWRAMRARIFPEILPGQEVTVSLTGVTEVDLAARMTSPWRWTL